MALFPAATCAYRRYPSSDCNGVGDLPSLLALGLTLAECLGRCDAASACAGVVFVPANGKCVPKSGDCGEAALTADSNADVYLPPGEEECSCSNDTLSHGSVTTSHRLAVGSTASLSCDDGFRLMGPPSLNCSLRNDSTVAWDGQWPVCEGPECCSGCMKIDHVLSVPRALHLCRISVISAGLLVSGTVLLIQVQLVRYL